MLQGGRVQVTPQDQWGQPHDGRLAVRGDLRGKHLQPDDIGGIGLIADAEAGLGPGLSELDGPVARQADLEGPEVPVVAGGHTHPDGFAPAEHRAGGVKDPRRVACAEAPSRGAINFSRLQQRGDGLEEALIAHRAIRHVEPDEVQA